MTLASPTTVTIGGVARVLSKIREDNFQSTYRLKATDLEINLNIRHTYEGKKDDQNPIERHNAEITYTVFALGVPTTYSAYIVLRAPRSLGATPVIDLAAGLFGWLTATTNANLTSVANWES